MPITAPTPISLAALVTVALIEVEAAPMVALTAASEVAVMLILPAEVTFELER